MFKSVTKGVLIAVVVAVGANAKVIATVNGYPITKSEADAFVKRATRGMATYNMLKPRDKEKVIKALATDKLIVERAKKEVPKSVQKELITEYYIRTHIKELQRKAQRSLSSKQKGMAIADAWVKKNSMRIKVSDSEIRAFYEKNKRLFKNRKTGKIIPYEKIKPIIKMQLQQKKFVEELMKSAKIEMGSKGLKYHSKSSSYSKSSSSSSYEIYTVKSGDSLSKIAHHFGVSIKAIKEANHMSNKSVIRVGEKLKIPKN